MLAFPNNIAARDVRIIRARRRRGFTFIELCMGLVVCSLIFAAMAAFTLATGETWRSATTMQSGSLRASQIALRLQNELRGCEAVLCYQPGSLTDAESQIRDADFAEESASLTRAQILVQSGTTVLQIANSNPQNVLALLR